MHMQAGLRLNTINQPVFVRENLVAYETNVVTFVKGGCWIAAFVKCTISIVRCRGIAARARAEEEARGPHGRAADDFVALWVRRISTASIQRFGLQIRVRSNVVAIL